MTPPLNEMTMEDLLVLRRRQRSKVDAIYNRLGLAAEPPPGLTKSLEECDKLLNEIDEELDRRA